MAATQRATKDIDDALGLLEDLTEEELAALEADFDPNDDFIPANERKLELQKDRMYEKRDMVAQLEDIVRKNQAESRPPEKVIPIRPWKNPIADNNNIKNKYTNKNKNNIEKKKYEKKKEEKVDYCLTAEEEELFEGLDEEELLELAALSNTHGLLTQDQARCVEMGNKEEHKGFGLHAKPVTGPSRRLASMSDDDTDLDGVLLLDSLKEDTDDVFYVRINNVPLETSLLHAIFDALKTTTQIKHLSLAGIGMKDEEGLLFNEAFKENDTLETVNLESNELTNEVMEPLFGLVVEHPTIREVKCSHQKHGLGSRGEEAMARALDKNERLLKVSYPFKVQSARSLADRCQIRNNEILRQKRRKGEDFYNYKEEINRRDVHPQPWIKDREDKNEKMKADLAEQKGRMKIVPNVSRMRFEAKQRAVENAKPTIDNELASKLQAAKTKARRGMLR